MGGRASQASQRKKKLLRDYLIELMDKQNPSVIDENGEPVTTRPLMAFVRSRLRRTATGKRLSFVANSGTKPVEAW
jgi:hypothetical protein